MNRRYLITGVNNEDSFSLMVSKCFTVLSPQAVCHVSTYSAGKLARYSPPTAFIPHLTISEYFLSTPNACCTCWAVVLSHLIRNTLLNVSSSGHSARLSNFPIIHFVNLGTNIGLNDFRLHFNSNITCGWCEMRPAPFPILLLFYNATTDGDLTLAWLTFNPSI